jgi:hypothetical protein
MTQLPQNLDEAIDQAQAATQAAIADGLTRLQVELLFPELKMMPIAQRFLTSFEPLGEELRVFFPDPGAAALARRDWGEKNYAIRGIGELKAKIQPQERVFLFIEPSSVEVAQLEELCLEAAERAVVLLAPRLEDVTNIGIGYAGRQLRERFLNQFEACYYLRPLEGAALYRCYPSPWQIWIEQDETFKLIAEESRKPVGEALDALLMGRSDRTTQTNQPVARRGGLFSGLKSFLRALSQ